MKIACLGGGPAGLYFAISMKLRQPDTQVTVFERNRANDTFGWGVVLSDDALGNLEANDPVSAATIRENEPRKPSSAEPSAKLAPAWARSDAFSSSAWK